ncbi:hypothetical protein GALMADRAFT_132365 [Galerina marginata CBS 339.88]|uniref:H/ACA ribonucleoprotein complex non-core subunit NAF1 n=1 Tax=Galerina marginata (strain CBS 339.88) TaxID=685588 RepID=A0A067U095_GALM3|nr:hypothetical protein GALMADRAFT_132365 [Galerina marginata CBS 339.88]
MDAFKVPHIMPQDLLLIQELVGVLPPVPASVPAAKSPVEDVKVKKEEDDDISSSDEEGEVASEEEIAAVLIAETGAVTDEDDLNVKVELDEKSQSIPLESSESESDSDSDSDTSDSSHDGARVPNPKIDQDLDDDEDPVPAIASGTYFQTKHELAEAEAQVPMPDVDEVGVDEALEKVGEVMNILDRVAIVRGLPSSQLNRGNDRALDSDTLLVFEDRKVMGYIYETFGPTTQPLYQVKFSNAFPLDPERVRVGREVFHVPTRSRFVFVNQIKVFKGSDASNVHDEEPADDELEFSDDEAEAAYRSRLKRKRGESRARSVIGSASNSRQGTPNPALMRDQELADEGYYTRNAYDERGPYDIDYSTPGPSSSFSSTSGGDAGSGRPAPIPYDDPYGDEYTAPDVVDREARASAPASTGGGSTFNGSNVLRDAARDSRGGGRGRDRQGDRGRGRGRDRDRGGPGHRDRERGRGRGAGAGGSGRGGFQSQSQRYGGGGSIDRQTENMPQVDAYGPRSNSQDINTRRSMSPTSLAIARATGEMDGPYPGREQNEELLRARHQQRLQQQHWIQAGMPNGYPMNGQFPFPTNFSYGVQHHQQGYQPQLHQPGFMMHPGAGGGGGVQPHINPRFASAFGMGMGMGVPGVHHQQLQQTYTGGGIAQMATQNVQQYGAAAVSEAGVASASVSISTPASTSQASWTDEWAVPVQERSSSMSGSVGTGTGTGILTGDANADPKIPPNNLLILFGG